MTARPAEREIIRILTEAYGTRGRLPLGFDDDVAAIPSKGGKWLVLKTDMLVASTDVPPGMSLFQAARKAVVATVSDFAAKGIRPKALLVSLGLPASINRKGVKQIAAGLNRAATEYGCRIAGGDTNQSNDLVIDCIGAGEADSNTLIRRNGALPGDIVVVTGPFGNSSAGLRLLTAGRVPRSDSEKALVRSVLYPAARLREGLALAPSRQVTSSIDSSDGLAWSLHELARASNVGIRLHTVPVSVEAKEFAEKNGISPVDLALYGGEEYELVLTTRRDGFNRLRRRVPSLIAIGDVHKDSRRVTASIDGEMVDVEARGWEHFRKRN